MYLDVENCSLIFPTMFIRSLLARGSDMFIDLLSKIGKTLLTCKSRSPFMYM